MILRHWTAAARIPLILNAGIRPTESNISLHQQHAGPYVVWLLPPDADPGQGNTHGLSSQKRTGWVDVRVPAIRWEEWEPAQAMDPEWRRIMILAGGGPEAAALWYVWPAVIRTNRIVRWHPTH